MAMKVGYQCRRDSIDIGTGTMPSEKGRENDSQSKVLASASHFASVARNRSQLEREPASAVEISDNVMSVHAGIVQAGLLSIKSSPHIKLHTVVALRPTDPLHPARADWPQ